MITALSKKLAKKGNPKALALGKGAHAGLPKEKKKEEADSGSSNTAVLRDEGKKKESQTVKIRTHFKENNSQSRGTKRFNVVLIEEGLGNLRDCFYYTQECLRIAADTKLFEGKKCYCDHPSAIDEQARPERSTRDIVGHFEDVKFEEDAHGVGRLTGILCVSNDQPNEWALSLLTHSLEYAKKYQDSDFVGLSINASGEASSMPIDQFMGSVKVPEGAKNKLALAKQEGISEIRPVSLLKEAISCDLVTEAGAGGKILKMMEGDKKPMKPGKESEKKEKEGMEGMEKDHQEKHHENEDDAGMGDHHDDEAQDKALFQKMIKQYLGKDEADQEEMEMAKHTLEAYQAEGMEGQEAYEAAGKHLKMALKIGSKMLSPKAKDGDAEPEESHKKESETESEAEKKEAKKESETKKESGIIKLSAENARLKEDLKKYQLGEYLDSKLKESKLPNSVTKKFREALGAAKSKEHIDNTLKVFINALNAREEVESEEGFVFTEKNSFRQSDTSKGMVSLEDCLE